MIKLSLALLLTAGAAVADAPVIEKATALRADLGWRFDVTLRHPDTGWDHFADGWEVVDQFDNRLGFRELGHPHVDEQPFTRSLSGIMVPDGIRTVYIRARCSVDGWASDKVAVQLRR